MSGRVTIKDIAKEANTSVCTVSKALTGKPKVSEKKRAEILAVAERMGYHVNRVAQSLVRKPIHIGIMVPAGWQIQNDPLLLGITNGLKRYQDYNLSWSVKQMLYEDVDSIPGKVDELLAEEVCAAIVCGDMYIDLSDVVKRFNERDIPLILTGAGLESVKCLSHIGIDTKRSGAMAAELASMITDGSAAVIIGHRTITGHIIKADSFEKEINRLGLRFVGCYEGLDEVEYCYELTNRILTEHPDLDVIYCATANSLPVIQCIEERECRTKIVATDIYPGLVKAMEEGTVAATLYQDFAKIGDVAVEALYRYLTESRRPRHRVDIPPEIVLKSNADIYLQSSLDSISPFLLKR